MLETDLMTIMSSNLGVTRYKGETEESFIERIVFSASRFWLEAFCLDDAYGGKNGCSRQLMGRRFNSWVNTLAEIYPTVKEWLALEKPHASSAKYLYDRLIMIGDLVSENDGRTYRCVSRHGIPLGGDRMALLGLYDPTLQNHGLLPISGMLLARTDVTESHLSLNPSWWELSDKYFSWISSSDQGEMEYFDPMSYTWSLYRPQAWKPDPTFYEGYGLGRAQRQSITDYFLVKPWAGSHRSRQITEAQARTLSVHLRSLVGRQLNAIIDDLDNSHAHITAPFMYLPPEASRWLNAMTWPIGSVREGKTRIIRTEMLNTAIEMLKTCEITIKRSH